MLLARLRAEVVGVGRRLLQTGLVVGTSGNVSARDPETGYIAISPSGMEYDRIEADDVPVVDGQGRRVEGRRRPSTELPTHLLVYRHRADVGAVVHTHSTYATVLAVLGWSLPPILGEAAAVLGGEVRVAEYATTGTEQLGRYTVEALEGRQAALLRNHGAIAVGRDLREALQAAWVLESTARVYWAARVAGSPLLLPPDEVMRVRQGYLAHYGQRPGGSGPRSVEGVRTSP
ncbi:class II aldolase/adducin family protein [Geochorda subterranea]|uniref:Class II aldolase/adducin family protein n=1 Tax=Geochorda subterranea TaxID=3109564 RepID=A0ABZ1BN24_9FIRM|nr:class II aldolase/adducin family protein [Limnochorda sp. LNt]WRP14244.1 class II aldolase/adducin family protein [Limnochorda sp. LNt]